MSAPFSPRVGDRVADRFVLESQLRGHGAVRVFSAHDSLAGRHVSVVLVDPERARANAWGAFAGIVATLAAARITGLVLPQGVCSTPPTPPYCVEEPQGLRGFDRLREQGALPWQRALTLGERAAKILGEAYAATGVAHRALTPARCASTVSDDVGILDYGVAELERDAPDDAGYRAPEQQRGGGDPRSDVYTLALILFELITGRSWAGTTPPNLRACVTVPWPVDEFFAKALSRDPAQRHHDVAAMRAAMRTLINTAADLLDDPLPAHVAAALPAAPARSPATPMIPSARRFTTPVNPSLDPLPIVPPARVHHGSTPIADRTEVVVQAAAQAPADRTEVVVQGAAPAPADRTVVAPSPAPAPPPADRTVVLAAAASPAPPPADRTVVLAAAASPALPPVDRTVLTAAPAARAVADRTELVKPPLRPQAAPIIRPALTTDPPTERGPLLPVPADTTLILPSEEPAAATPQVARSNDASLASSRISTPPPPEPLKKALIWINVVCFSAILLVLCIRALW